MIVFKVDFEKAYDTVFWEFLQDVMEKIGFGYNALNRPWLLFIQWFPYG